MPPSAFLDITLDPVNRHIELIRIVQPRYKESDFEAGI